MAITKYHNNNNLRYCFIFLSINISISFTKNPNIPSHHECATYAAQNAWCKHWNHTIVQGVHQSLESICRSKMFWSKIPKTYYILVDLKSVIKHMCSEIWKQETKLYLKYIWQFDTCNYTFSMHTLYHCIIHLKKELCRFTIFLQLIN